MSESLDWDSSKEGGDRICSSSEHCPMAEMEAMSQSTYTEDINQKWNEYAGAGIDTYIALHRRKMGESED